MNRLVRIMFFMLWLPGNFLTLLKYKISIRLVSEIKGRLNIIGGGRVVIGPGFRCNSGEHFNVIGGDTKLNFVVRKSAQIIIGENCGISNSTLVAHKKIEIGKNVLIGGGVKIYDSNFHSLHHADRRIPKVDQSNTLVESVTIGDDVFIGSHTIILKGSVIGDRCIIGAGSVVRGYIPSDQIWAGNPAKCLRRKC